MALAVELLLCKCKALSSNPSPVEGGVGEERRGRQEERKGGREKGRKLV
jgi:hypothetical protein